MAKARKNGEVSGWVSVESTLTQEDFERLELFCAATLRSRRAAVRYAVRRLLEQWEEQIAPEVDEDDA